MRRALYAAIALTMWHGTVNAADTIKETIVKYLDYDLQGTRLSAETSNDIYELTTGEPEPGWDVVNVVTGYTIRSIKINNSQAVAKVGFLNSWEESQRFSPRDIKLETVELDLRKIDGKWKIAAPYHRPHVLPSVVKKNLEDAIRYHKIETALDNEYIADTSRDIEAITKYIGAIK